MELQFTPTRTASAVHKSTVDAAFLEAAIPIVRWTVPAGEDDVASKYPQMRFADPTLDIRVHVAEEGTDHYATGMATFTLLPQLASACSAIRAALPELPMHIEERVANQHRHLGFRLTDDSAAIARSFEGFPREGLGDTATWFWSSDEGRWVELVVTRRKGSAPGSPWTITASERSP